MRRISLLCIHITITDDKGNQYDGDTILNKSVITKSSKAIPQKRASRPSDAISQLYQNNFFKEKRKLSDVTTMLSKKGYNFNVDSVYRALERANFLNVTGTKGSYRFVQKYPFNE